MSKDLFLYSLKWYIKKQLAILLTKVICAKYSQQRINKYVMNDFSEKNYIWIFQNK